MQWRKEEWARRDWSRKVNKTLEKAYVERNSSETLITSAEGDLEVLTELLDRTKRAVDLQVSEARQATQRTLMAAR